MNRARGAAKAPPPGREGSKRRAPSAAREALRESEGRYRAQSRELRAVLDATHAQLALLDPGMRFLMVNDAYESACGHRRAELIGRGHFEFFPNEENERIFRRVAETGEPFYVNEKPFSFADQPERGVTYWNWSLVPVKGEDGALQAVLLSLLDVTAQVEARRAVEQLAAERDRTARALREDAELRERFLAVLSHDLRSPMSVVQANVQYLLRRCTNAEDRAPLERALRATRAMGSLVGALLDWARIRSGRGIPTATAPADLGEICRRVVEDAEGALHRGRISLSTEGDLSGSWDAERLAEALGNLVSNALRHGDPEAPVRVRASASGDSVVAEVSNQGRPIPAEDLPTLFDPFSAGRVREGAARGPGLGLGLYIVREIAKAHAGTVEVASTHDGTAFTLRLPRRRAP